MRVVTLLLFFFGAMVAQWAWGTYFSVFGLAPQVLLILTAAVAARTGPVVGQCFAFPWGLFLDMLGVHLFGGQALSLTLIAYLIGSARRQMDISDPMSQAMVVGMVSLAQMAFLGLAGLVFEGHVFWPGWKLFIFGTLLNAVAAPFAFAAVQRYIKPSREPR